MTNQPSHNLDFDPSFGGNLEVGDRDSTRSSANAD